MSLDAARLSAIRERLDKATPGPWEVAPLVDPSGWRIKGPEYDSPHPGSWHDSALIANAPTDLADLLAAHDELTAQVAALHDALQDWPSHELYCRVMQHMHAVTCDCGGWPQEVRDALADTAAAAEAFRRQQRLEGARALASRFLSRPQTMADALADMEREASA